MKRERNLSVERRMNLVCCAVTPQDSVAHARAIIDTRGVRHLPVLSRGRVVGIVSSREMSSATCSAKRPALARALSAQPDRVTVGSVMTREIPTVNPKDSIVHAAVLMQRANLDALPVTEQECLVGIITRSDVNAAYPDRAHVQGAAQPLTAALDLALPAQRTAVAIERRHSRQRGNLTAV